MTSALAVGEVADESQGVGVALLVGQDPEALPRIARDAGVVVVDGHCSGSATGSGARAAARWASTANETGMTANAAPGEPRSQPATGTGSGPAASGVAHASASTTPRYGHSRISIGIP